MMNATAVSQKLTLFMRGNAMSGAPIISGTNQLPKPPIIAGMTMKNTMIRPCAVIITFQKCLPCTSPAAPIEELRPAGQILDARLGQFAAASGPKSRRRRCRR